MQSVWGGGSRVDELTGYPLACLPPPSATALSVPPAGHIPSSPSTAKFNPFPPLNGLVCLSTCLLQTFRCLRVFDPDKPPCTPVHEARESLHTFLADTQGTCGRSRQAQASLFRNYHAVSQSTGSVPPVGHERARSPMSQPARRQPGSLLPATLTSAWLPPGAPGSRPSSP